MTEDDDVARIEAFVKDLGALYEKHEIVVDGCCCHESPFLTDVRSKEAAFGRGNLYDRDDKGLSHFLEAYRTHANERHAKEERWAAERQRERQK